MADFNVVILGDFMIDRHWLMSEAAHPTAQRHGEKQTLMRLHPQHRSDRLGGAGMALTSLQSNVSTLQPDSAINLSIHCLGIWDPGEADLLSELASQGDLKPFCRSRLHRLEVDASLPCITTKKIRYYTEQTTDIPSLLFRCDQDFITAPGFVGMPKDFPADGTAIDAVLLADFGKGAVSVASVLALTDRTTANTHWILDSSKVSVRNVLEDDRLCGKLEIEYFALNRREAFALASAISTEALVPIPDSAQITPQLLQVIMVLDKWAKNDCKVPIRNILVKLDRFGAFALHVDSNSSEIAYFPVHRQVHSDGIAAGDFVNAELLRRSLLGSSWYDAVCNACAFAESWLEYEKDFWLYSLSRVHQSDIVSPFIFAKSVASPYMTSGGKQCSAATILRQKRLWYEGTMRQEYDDVGKWKFPVLRKVIEENDKTFRFTEIMSMSEPRIVLSDAKGFLSDFSSADPRFRAQVVEFLEELRSFIASTGRMPPMNCLIVAKPGSGKSYFAKQLAQAIGAHLVEINCSQLVSPEDLLESLTELQNAPSDKTPMLFLDEVDTNEELYPYLLAPLWDAETIVNGKKKRWRRKMISMLVASDETFVTKLDNVKKGPDLKSRLKGRRLLLGEADDREQTLTSRIYLVCDLLLRYQTKIRAVRRGFLDFVYCAPVFNPRAIEHFISSLPPAVDGVCKVSDTSSRGLRELSAELGCSLAEKVPADSQSRVLQLGLVASVLKVEDFFTKGTDLVRLMIKSER